MEVVTAGAQDEQHQLRHGAARRAVLPQLAEPAEPGHRNRVRGRRRLRCGPRTPARTRRAPLSTSQVQRVRRLLHQPGDRAAGAVSGSLLSVTGAASVDLLSSATGSTGSTLTINNTANAGNFTTSLFRGSWSTAKRCWPSAWFPLLASTITAIV